MASLSPSALSLLLPVLLLLLTQHRPITAQKQQELLLTSFAALDSPWLPSQNRTLVSPDFTFAAGFRHSATSPTLFLFSIWVRAAADRTVIWSLDRLSPVNASAALSISSLGRLSLPDLTGKNLFPPSASSADRTPDLLLRDDGSLSFGNWTSADEPTDTLLAGQTVVSLSSGEYRFVNSTSLVFRSRSSYWSIGPVRGLNSTGGLFGDNNSSLAITTDSGEEYLRRLTLDSDGNLRIYTLDNRTGNWRSVWQAVQELCTIRGTCGLNSICVPNGTAPVNCVCPPGYSAAGSDCRLKTPYSPKSKFLSLNYVSFSAGNGTSVLPATGFERCQSSCLSNDSCVAFSYKLTGELNSCFNHFDRLADSLWSPVSDITMHIRVSIAERDSSNFTGMEAMIDTGCPANVSLLFPPDNSTNTSMHIGFIIAIFAVEVITSMLAFCAFLRQYSKYRDIARNYGMELLPGGGPRRFSHAELKAATGDFAQVIGRGSFGIVYKGVLPDDRMVAIKKLKSAAPGGEAEFWAEVTIIARMHHLNLVRLWGFCAEKKERMLVYEYIPNGSLDKYLFSRPGGKIDQPNRPLLDWGIRYRIAIGVARAIAYLHEECLEWVLHCDIKPENILLEDEFCPKVTDFGLSKLAEKKDKVTMSAVRGTRGYLAPEWVIPGEPITAKADVFSFGMVLLEIVTGVRNFEFRQSSKGSEEWYLPKWAFDKVYVEKRVEDILDSRILHSFDDRENLAAVERMVKTAMWCLQDRASMRPSMGKVAKMLEGTVEITEPVKPMIFSLTGEEESSMISSTVEEESFQSSGRT